MEAHDEEKAAEQYSADLKAKITVGAIKGQRTIQGIASHLSIHPTMVTNWKRQLLEGAAEMFSNGGVRVANADEQSTDSWPSSPWQKCDSLTQQ